MTTQQYFDLLRKVFEEHNIAEANVDYNGGGDSGSFEPCNVIYTDGTEAKLNSLYIFLKDVPYMAEQFDDAKKKWVKVSEMRDISFDDFVVEAAEHFVGLNHGGWENNDGGYGSVRFFRERDGISALSEALRQRIHVENHHVDYVQTEEESDHAWCSDAE